MNTDRRTAILVGILFLTATVTTMVGDSLIVSTLNDPDYVAQAYADRTQVTIGVLIAFINALAILGIAVLFYPILKRQNEPMALGYVGVRTAEIPMLLLWLIIPLVLTTLGQEYLRAGDPDAAVFQALGAVLMGLRLWTWRMVYLINGVATLTLAYLLYRSRCVPRSISVLGLVGGAVLLAGTALAMLGSLDPDQGAGLLVVVPGGLFELILPLWLIIRGFNAPAIASDSDSTVIDERESASLARA